MLMILIQFLEIWKQQLFTYFSALFSFSSPGASIACKVTCLTQRGFEDLSIFLWLFVLSSGRILSINLPSS